MSAPWRAIEAAEVAFLLAPVRSLEATALSDAVDAEL